MGKKVFIGFLVFILEFIFTTSFLAPSVQAQTMTINPPTLTARDEGGVEVTVTGLRTDLGYYAFIQRAGGFAKDIFGRTPFDSRRPDATGVLQFRVCGGNLNSYNDCTGQGTFLEGSYEVWISTRASISGTRIARSTFEVKVATSNITIDFLNTSWTTNDDVIVRLSQVSDGSYLIRIDGKDPSQGGNCFDIRGGSVDRNIGKYFEKSYILQVFDNRGGFPNVLCDKGSLVAQAGFTIKNDGSGGPTSTTPPGTTPTICVKGDLKCTLGGGKGCDDDPSNPGIQTAIGCIHTSPVGFVKDFLKFALGISGGLAFLLMLLGAFQMITSAGNPDTLAAGKDRLTNAVIGLLFVIFAVLLLQIIGVDILGIPGFGR